MIIAEFSKCPICHSKKTAAQLGCAGESGIPEGQFVSIEQKVTFLKPPQLAIGLSAPAIISYFDICADCGYYYCTRVEKGSIPVQVKVPGTPFSPQGYKG